ncbi:CotS family spore coat protein [Hathewaya massiliensis]|uniref:CotS family spore coat protein n=1 Tax=Hathewaya massiliensis TaxID=1964382 RepID=UPI00115828E0|nr:CotS family spore coat protein [Hathewaya massiliensis]
MIDIKYKDRDFLKDYSLDIDLFRKFNLHIKDVAPIRKVFIVSSEEGDFIIKKLDYEAEDLEFINRGLEYVKSRGFERTFSFRKNLDGNIIETYKGSNYCIMNLINGRESVYSNPIDIALGTRSLGSLHSSSKGFYHKLEKRDFRGKLINKLENEIHEIKLLKELVLRYHNKKEMDEIFLNNVDYLIKKGEESVNLLKKSQYHKLCDTENAVAFCHHDLAYHNILIKDEQAYFIDFDYAIIDLKVHDIANYIYKVVKNFAYDINKATFVIDNYKEVYTLKKEEIEVLYGMLLFPYKSFTLFKHYYFRQKDWEYISFLEKVKNKVSCIQEKEEFMERFKEIYLINYN